MDNHAVKGDAGLCVEGIKYPIGPTSDATGIAIAQAMICQVCENLVKAGMEPPIFTSSNVDGGDAKNVELYAKYYGYWK